MRDIELRLDTATASALRDALTLLGEHIAAGAPIPALPASFHERVGAVLRELDRQLAPPSGE